MDIENLRLATTKLQEAMSMFGQGPLDFYLQELLASYDLLMKKYAPFKVGDRVRLAIPPTITPTENPGWLPYKGFLREGALGTVVSSGCGNGGFWFNVAFDDDHWIHPHTKEHIPTPPERRKCFRFTEHTLSLNTLP